MASPRSTAAHASVVFLKIPEFSNLPVAEQVRLKDRLEGSVAAALAGLDESRRIVLEAPDGAAVVVLGSPVSALEFARASARGEAGGVTVGVSHGPVRVADDGTSSIVLGDGIAVAATVAGFAPPGRVAATREFRQALVRSEPAAALRLAPAGTHNDARDRSYELFFFDEAHAIAHRRRRILGVAALSVAIVGAGVAARLFLRGPAPVALPVSATGPKSAEPPKPAAPAAVPTAPPAPEAPPPPALATLRLEIRPQGEVLIDGAVKGKSPPLSSIQIAPGKHTIEVRRAGSSTLLLRVDAGPGEELTIRHTFAAPPPKSAWRKFFDQFK